MYPYNRSVLFARVSPMKRFVIERIKSFTILDLEPKISQASSLSSILLDSLGRQEHAGFVDGFLK